MKLMRIMMRPSALYSDNDEDGIKLEERLNQLLTLA